MCVPLYADDITILTQHNKYETAARKLQIYIYRLDTGRNTTDYLTEREQVKHVTENKSLLYQ